MKKLKQFMLFPKGTLAVFGAAIGLLLLSSIGGARAALTYYSENHMTELGTQTIDVSLLENGRNVDGKELLTNLLGKNETKVKVGEKYEETLSVQNSGEIDQYVRVTIYKYWVKKSMDGEGKVSETKVKDVYPGYIELDIADGWEVDSKASTQERTVLYYKGILKNDGNSVEFLNGLRINPTVATIISKDGGNVSYDYQGLEFRIKVDVDAVQTHNAADAILSSWGREVDNSGADENGVLSNLIFK